MYKRACRGLILLISFEVAKIAYPPAWALHKFYLASIWLITLLQLTLHLYRLIRVGCSNWIVERFNFVCVFCGCGNWGHSISVLCTDKSWSGALFFLQKIFIFLPFLRR
ncbi:hypothetical protein J6590_098832, partial [Homalodisca vitripennis]